MTMADKKIFSLPVGPTAMIFKGVIIGPGNVTFDNEQDYKQAKARQDEITAYNARDRVVEDTGPQMHFGSSAAPAPKADNGNGEEDDESAETFNAEEQARIKELMKADGPTLKNRADTIGLDLPGGIKKSKAVEMIVLAERNH